MARKFKLANLKPLPVRKFIRLLVPAGAKVPADLGGKVALCMGLRRAVKNCEWQVINIYAEGSKVLPEREAELRERAGELGVAVVRLTPDNAPIPVKLIRS